MTKREVDKLLVEERRTMRAGRTRKSDVDKLLVDERKKMRTAQKESKFKSRTLSTYRAQMARAAELGQMVHYSLDQFRARLAEYAHIDKAALREHMAHYGAFPAGNRAGGASIRYSYGGTSGRSAASYSGLTPYRLHH